MTNCRRSQVQTCPAAHAPVAQAANSRSSGAGVQLCVLASQSLLLPASYAVRAALPQVLDLAELDFSRYGDVLFEVAFAGARLTTGGNVAVDGQKLDFNVSPALLPCCTLCKL